MNLRHLKTFENYSLNEKSETYDKEWLIKNLKWRESEVEAYKFLIDRGWDVSISYGEINYLEDPEGEEYFDSNWDEYSEEEKNAIAVLQDIGTDF